MPCPLLPSPPPPRSPPPPLQGRMLHVLPSTIKKEASEDAGIPGASSYKKKKEARDKASSSRCQPTTRLWAWPGLPLPLPRPLPAARALAPRGGWAASGLPSLSPAPSSAGQGL